MPYSASSFLHWRKIQSEIIVSSECRERVIGGNAPHDHTGQVFIPNRNFITETKTRRCGFDEVIFPICFER